MRGLYCAWCLNIAVKIAVLFTVSEDGYVLPATQDYDFMYLSENLPISLNKLSVLHIELVCDAHLFATSHHKEVFSHCHTCIMIYPFLITCRYDSLLMLDQS